MSRGKDFEEKVGKLFLNLQSQYPNEVGVFPQFEVTLNSGRKVQIDYKITIEFPHEIQSYYFELQSRNKHDHALSDKVEAIRRDTPLSTFSFVHESPLESSVSQELKARNILPKDWNGIVAFVEGIELQLLQQRSAARVVKGLDAHDDASENRLKELVARLGELQDKPYREVASSEPDAAQQQVIEEIIEEVKRDPGAAIRQARRFLRF